MKKKNFFIRGSTVCLLVFAMVLILTVPNGIAAATTQSIAFEKQINFTGFKTDALANVPITDLPAEYVFRINDSQSLYTWNTNYSATAAIATIISEKMRAGPQNAVITVKTDVIYHPKIC